MPGSGSVSSDASLGGADGGGGPRRDSVSNGRVSWRVGGFRRWGWGSMLGCSVMTLESVAV